MSAFILQQGCGQRGTVLMVKSYVSYSMVQHGSALLRSTATWITISSMCSGLPGRIPTGLLFTCLHNGLLLSPVGQRCIHLMKSLFCPFALLPCFQALQVEWFSWRAVTQIKILRTAFFNSTSCKNPWNPVKPYQQSESPGEASMVMIRPKLQSFGFTQVNALKGVKAKALTLLLFKLA